jgi:hypothetical protein
MAEQGDICIANVMIGDTAELTITHMMCAEQIVLNECDVAAISNRGGIVNLTAPFCTAPA